ncbi:hypothetical protein [Desulfogranum marinum]|uniref:hypothetical protein n=1 Tax=Desulfogranum marinum TaxID=453220 RepID=UPI0029C95811|nr:hypothetical protein [Desulfogranum marinum]
MIEMCIDGARTVVERWKQFLLSPLGIYLYSLITGAVGIVILLMFFSMVLSPAALLILLPGIIGFNGATAGYGLLDKCSSFPRPAIALTSISLLFAIIGCAVIAVLQPWEPPIAALRSLLATLFALSGTFSGAWIAKKKTRLNK